MTLRHLLNPQDSRWTHDRHNIHLTTHRTHNIHASMPPAGIEPATPLKQPSQPHVLNRSTTAIARPPPQKNYKFWHFQLFCHKKTPLCGTSALSSEFHTHFIISFGIEVSCTLSTPRREVGVSVGRRRIHSRYWFAINQDSVYQGPVSCWLLYNNRVYWSVTTSPPKLPGSFSFGFSFANLWRFSGFHIFFKRERSSLFIFWSQVLVSFFGRRRHSINIHPFCLLPNTDSIVFYRFVDSISCRRRLIDFWVI